VHFDIMPWTFSSHNAATPSSRATELVISITFLILVISRRFVDISRSINCRCVEAGDTNADSQTINQWIQETIPDDVAIAITLAQANSTSDDGSDSHGDSAGCCKKCLLDYRYCNRICTTISSSHMLIVLAWAALISSEAVRFSIGCSTQSIEYGDADVRSFWLISLMTLALLIGLTVGGGKKR
jgi:hypothetical protein